MDWLRLFALLIAVASVHIVAEGPKKKIRIHLPQKVKHIHHHKKIYITNHPASSQYAPAYLPSADGAVAVPSNIGMPAVASLMPLNSVELYDEAPSRLPGGSPAASKLLPLYRARGYYGPTPSEIDDQEYDLSPPPEPTDQSYDYAPIPQSPPERPKRVKVIKVKESPRKKATKKQKPKRGPVRSRPRPDPEEEHPVSSFHEQFYSDVDGSGTVRKTKRPQRVEKIIDGDTEHIHTYSEEHIHKLVYDEASKLANVLGMDPVASMSALSASRPLIPFNNGQPLLAISPEALSGFVGAPSHLDYSAYNPRDVTHDHIFHDHGEIPSGLDITKESLSQTPKLSYNSQGLRVSGSAKRPKNKYANKFPKQTKPTLSNDFSYYENIYTPYSGLKKQQKPKIPQYDAVAESHVDDYRPLPSFKLHGKNKPRAYGQSAMDFRQTSAPSAPFSVSSTVVHDYQPKAFPGALPPTGFSKFRDPFVNFKDSYANNFEYDTFASSTNVHTSEDKNDNSLLALPGSKGKKKSVSTQNIRFGGENHQSTIDHLEDSSISELNDDDTPTALENFSSFDETRSQDSAQSTPFTIRESSPAHQYYQSMAVKALHNEQGSAPEASNDNFQYAEPPPQSTTPVTPSVATTIGTSSQYFDSQNSNLDTTEPSEYAADTDKRRRQRTKNTNKMNHVRDNRQRYPVIMDYKGDDRPLVSHTIQHSNKYLHNLAVDSNLRGELKYGDKI